MTYPRQQGRDPAAAPAEATRGQQVNALRPSSRPGWHRRRRREEQRLGGPGTWSWLWPGADSMLDPGQVVPPRSLSFPIYQVD